MKNLVLTAFTLIATVQLGCAGLLDDLVGKWKTNNTGSGSSITTSFKKVGSKGLQMKTSIVIPGLEKASGVTDYKSDGTISGKVTRGGVVQVRISGTWRISGNTLAEDVRLTGSAFPGVATQKTKVKLVSSNKLSTSTVLNGTRTNGSLSRLR